MTGVVVSLPDFEPVLERLRQDAEQRLGVSPLRFVPVNREERPFTRLLRVSVHRSGDVEPLTHFFVKIFKVKPDVGVERTRERIVRDFDVNRRVHDAMQPLEELGAVPPVACYPDLLAIVTEQVTGPTLLDHLQMEAAWFPAAARIEGLCRTVGTAGRWIREFQGSATGGGCVAIEDLCAYVDHRLQRLVRHGTFSTSDRAQVLTLIDHLGARIAAEDLKEVPIHSDLALGNIIVSGRRIVVLDFAMTKLGTRLHDLSRLFLQIELLAIKPQLRATIAGQLQRSLLEGFEPGLTVEHPLFRLLMLLHRVNHFTSLSLNRASLPAAIYNNFVRRHHRRSIAAELQRGPVESLAS